MQIGNAGCNIGLVIGKGGFLGTGIVVAHVQCECVVASLGCRLTEFGEVGLIEGAAVAMDQQQGARTRLRGMKNDAVQAHTIRGAQGYQFGGTSSARRNAPVAIRRRWRLRQ